MQGKIIKLTAIIFLFPTLADAGWPIFAVPSTEQVIAQIEQTNCPAGEGRVLPDTQLPIKIFNNTWYWRYQGASECQKLPVPITQIQYHTFNATGRFSKDVITVGYGDTAQHAMFLFELTIPSCSWATDEECRWECAPLQNDTLPTRLWCAYDS